MAVLDYTDVWIADPAGAGYPWEPTERLIDLNELEQDCDCGWGLDEEGIVMGDEDTLESMSLSSPSRDGVLRAWSSHGEANLFLPLIYKRCEGRDLVEDTIALADALQAGGVLAYQLQGREEPIFWDFDTSPTVTLLYGQRIPFVKIAHKGVIVDALVVEFHCPNPWPRLAPVPFGPLEISNAVGERDILLSHPGTRPSELMLELTPDGSLTEIRYGIRDHGDLDEFRSFYMKAANTGSPRTDATIEAVTGADSGQAVVIDFATEPQLARRYREQRVITIPSGAEGSHNVYARLRAINGDTETTQHKVQFRHGYSTTDRVMENAARVPLDWRNVDALTWVEPRVGRINIPPGATKVVLELWAMQQFGNQELAFDGFILEPADLQHGIVYPPGFRLGGWGSQIYSPEDLEGTGSLVRDTFRLDSEGEKARTDSKILAAGVHEITFEVDVREPSRASVVEAEGRIIYKPATDNVTRKKVKIRSRKDQLWTRRIRKTVAFEVTQAEADAGDRWRFEAVQVATDANRRRTEVTEIEHKFMEAIASGQPLVLDSTVSPPRTYARDGVNEGVPLFSAIHENEAILVPPKESVVVFALGDRQVDPGYKDDVDERGPLSKSVQSRSAVIGGFVIPRVWGVA